MTQVKLKINGILHTVEAPSDMPLLWVLREKLDLLGTKYGCGIGLCGTCTVLVDGEPAQSCLLPAASLASAEITTIEGLDPDANHPVQRAWNDEDVAQCGYCQGGQVLTAVALLERNPDPGEEEIDEAMAGRLCRCGTYPRIRKAIKLAAKYRTEEGGAS
jgi:isoquinoline 1-oxidoreductase alpha subunit